MPRQARRLGFEPRVGSGSATGPRASRKHSISFCAIRPTSPKAPSWTGVREYEPDEALFAGRGRLDAYRALGPQLPGLLTSGGIAAVEIGFDQAEAVTALLARDGLEVQVAPDLAGRPRALLLTWI